MPTTSPRLWVPSRRDMLRMGAVATGAAMLGLPRGAAALEGSRRKFVFVFARGGWDTTRVFSPMFQSPNVQTEADAETLTLGDHVIVDHPDRPSVRAFFQQYGSRAAVLDGMLVRSVNHSICERLVLTADSRPTSPDWPSILGAAVGSEHALPNLVLAGPSAPGELHRYTSIIGRSDQMQTLIDGTVIETRGDLHSRPLQPSTEALTDAYMDVRVAAALQGATHPAELRMMDAYADALARVERLKADGQLVQFAGEGGVDQTQLSVELLRYGVARVSCMSLPGFDTHADIDLQVPLLEGLFATLLDLMAQLEAAPGTEGGSLADETVVVVLSEMGRTPYTNNSGGKDHWPYTAAMLLGPGVQGGRRIGGYDAFLNGRPIDLASGAITEAGVVLTPTHLGSTLLTLADIDPAEWLKVPDPIRSVLV